MIRAFQSLLMLPVHRSRSAAFEPELDFDWQAALGFLLTFAKIPFALLAVSLVMRNRSLALSALIIVAIVFDVLDGVIFGCSRLCSNRALRERRRIWDSCLDRVFMFSVLVPAVVVMHFPTTVFALVTVRELVVWVVTALPYLNSGFVHKPNLPSKLGATLAGFTVIFFNLVGNVPLTLIILFTLFSVTGIALYVVRPVRI